MVIFTRALLLCLVCRVIINSKGWEDLYIQSYLYSANCKGMKLFAKYFDSSKKKMSDTKSLRLIQHVLLIRILCYIRSLSMYTREKV